MKKALIVAPLYPDPYYIDQTYNIARWVNTLQNYRGFTSITVKQGTQNKTAIQSAITSFVNSLGPGQGALDMGAIILVGHGGQITDTSGDEADHIDECFAASDILPISDDWLGATLATVYPGTPIDIVNDMCYAGTSTRAPDEYNPISDNVFPRPEPYLIPIEAVEFKQKRERARHRPKLVVPVPGLNHRLWAATSEGGSSWGVLYGGRPYHLFTLYLTYALCTYPYENATEIMNMVEEWVTDVMPSQVPQLEGSNLTEIPF